MQKLSSLPELPQLGHCRKLVHNYDWHRYIASLYLPSPLRELCWILAALNIEVARTADSVSKETMGQIRLKWWLEVLETAQSKDTIAREHPVAESLTQVIRHYSLPITPLVQMIQARESDLKKGVIFENIRALDHYATATGGIWKPLATLTEDSQAENTYKMLESLGQHWALLGLIRATGHHLNAKRSYIPEQVLMAHDISNDSLFESNDVDLLCHLIEALNHRLEAGLRNIADMLTKCPRPFQAFGTTLEICKFHHDQLKKAPETALTLQAYRTNTLALQWHLLKSRFCGNYSRSK